MFQHSPNILIESCGSSYYTGISASSVSNLTSQINSLGIKVGESVLYFYATNSAVGAVTVAHTGLTPFTMTSGGNTDRSFGFAVVHYPLGLLPNTQLTFSKSNFWGTSAVFEAIRLTNGYGAVSRTFVTFLSYTAGNTASYGITQTAAAQIKPGYKKSTAYIVATIAASNTALTSIAPGWFNYGLNNFTNLSHSISGLSRAISKTGNEIFSAQFSQSATNLSFCVIRIAN
jgi:hypothetical protein